MSYRTDFKSCEREVFFTLPRVALGLIVVLCIVYGLGFLSTGGDLAIYRFWVPKQENARRQVFENTQSYVQGKVEYLGRLRQQWMDADEGHKASIRMLVITEASTVDNDKLPIDLQGFVASMKGRQ